MRTALAVAHGAIRSGDASQACFFPGVPSSLAPERMTEFRPIALSSRIGNSAPVTPNLKDRGDLEQLAEEGEVSQLMFQLISKHSRLNLLIRVMKQLEDRSMEV